ncbi:hypothetical protein ACFLYK_00845 [Candidatus Cloacimonadota bacterium]
MKETPKEHKIHKNLKAGAMSSSGFLGDDERHYHEIIEDDRVLLRKLGTTTKHLAERMQYFTEKAFESYDGPVLIDEKFKVFYDSYRGKILCPFNHSGVFRKGTITLKNLENGIEICWTPLNIHMIEEHCFFEGKGSIHRLEPELLFKAIY